MVRYRWPRAPLVLGLVLGEVAERYLWLSVARSAADRDCFRVAGRLLYDRGPAGVFSRHPAICLCLSQGPGERIMDSIHRPRRPGLAGLFLVVRQTVAPSVC